VPTAVPSERVPKPDQVFAERRARPRGGRLTVVEPTTTLDRVTVERIRGTSFDAGKFNTLLRYSAS
jgi:hypothetical protein